MVYVTIEASTWKSTFVEVGGGCDPTPAPPSHDMNEHVQILNPRGLEKFLLLVSALKGPLCVMRLVRRLREAACGTIQWLLFASICVVLIC